MPSLPGRSARIGALLVLVSSAAPPAGAQLAVVSQTRSVEVAIGTEEATYASCVPLLDPSCMPDSVVRDTFGDDETAPDAGPFDAAAAVSGFPDTSAQQSSRITPSGISATGSHGASSSYTSSGGFPVTLHSELHDTVTRLEVEFTLAEATAYTLTGSVTTTGILADSSARIALVGPGGMLGEVEVGSDPGCTDPSCASVGPQPLALGGRLVPGHYTLEAVAMGTASGLHGTSGSFGGAHEGSFEVALALGPGVPALPGWAPPLLALALAGSAVAVRRRPPR